jgi:hypothetical protein
MGSMLQNDGDIDEDVNHRIKVGWLKWRQTSGVLCKPRVPKNRKANFKGLWHNLSCCIE